MTNERLFAMPFSELYRLYIAKAERKGRTSSDVDAIISWLTGYGPADLRAKIDQAVDLRTFFDQAPAVNVRIDSVRGTVCGVRVEAVEDPLLRKIRALDRLIDELAKGRSLDRILGVRD